MSSECEQPYHIVLLNTAVACIPPSTYRTPEGSWHPQCVSLRAAAFVRNGPRCAAEARCPVTEDVSVRLLRFPFYNDLTESDQSEVVAAVTSFVWGAKKAATT